MLEQSTIEKVFDFDRPLFSRDFIVVDLLPSVFFAGSIAAVLMAGAPGHAPNGRDLTASLAQTTSASLVLLLAVSLAIGIITHPSRLGIRRLLTGNWNSRIGSRFAKTLTERARDRFAKTNTEAKVSDPNVSSQELQRLERKALELMRRWPPAALVKATRLGNAYEALRKLVPESEELSVLVDGAEPKAFRDAYGRAAQKKEPIVHLIDDVRLQVAAAERYTIVWGAIAVVYAWLLVRHGWWWALVPAVALLLAYAAYRGAVEGVVNFNRLVDHLFDLVRTETGDEQASEKESGGSVDTA